MVRKPSAWLGLAIEIQFTTRLSVEDYFLDDVGKVGHNLDLTTRPMMRLGVPRTQRPNRMPCVIDERYADVGTHYAACGGRMIPEYRIVCDVVDDEWRAAHDCVYAERFGEGMSPLFPMSSEREAIPAVTCSTSVIMFSAAFGIPTASIVKPTI